MKRRYCSPAAESISIEMYIVAASTGGGAEASRMFPGTDGDGDTGSWGNIWK